MSIIQAFYRYRRGLLWIGLVIAVLAAIPFASSTVVATRDGRGDAAFTDTKEGRLAVFDDVWETIYERYYDPTFKGLDWNAPRTALRLEAAEAGGSEKLYEILQRMIDALNDPHTRVYSPEKKSDWWQPRFTTVGLSVREVEVITILVEVEPYSAPARAGIKPGDEIVSVDDVPAAESIKKRFDALRRPSTSMRARAVSTLLEGEAGSFATLRWKTKNGSTASARFERFWRERHLTFKINHRDKYLVLELQTFTNSLVLDLVRELRSGLQGVRGLVFDLRSNGGGDAYAMASIASVFLGEGVPLGRFTDRAGAAFELTTQPNPMMASQVVAKQNFSIAVLVGERTSSAAEILASALQRNRRAKLLGTASCGCVLAIRARHTLPDRGVLDVSEFDYRTPDGVRLEGKGVSPDEVIVPLRRDFYSKRDRVLEAALEHLKRYPSR